MHYVPRIESQHSLCVAHYEELKFTLSEVISIQGEEQSGRLQTSEVFDIRFIRKKNPHNNNLFMD